MIYTNCKITVKNSVATIDHKIIIYKGDKNIEVKFEILASLYRQYKLEGGNTILNLGASHGQLVILGPNGAIFSGITPTEEGKIILTIPSEMTDEDVEIGDYTFQIRLFDEAQTSRVTLPPIENGLEIRLPIASETSS